MTATATTATAARPASCGAYSAASPDKAGDRLATCKRLPMHKGECRPTLTAPTVKRSKSGKAKVSGRSKPRVTRAEFATKLAADVESGKLSAGDALSRMAAYVTKAGKRTPRVTKPREAGELIVVVESDAETFDNVDMGPDPD